MQSRISPFHRLTLKATRFSCRVALLVLGSAAACTADAPTVPHETPVVADSAKAPKAPQPSPPVSVAIGVYERITPSAFEGSSRYRIYDDSTFTLEYSSAAGEWEGGGKYLIKGNVITLDFNTTAPLGPWMAEAVLENNDLIVKYNEVMLATDFEDGIYRLLRPPPAVAGIYVGNADGSDITFLTEGDRPSWSPDGKRLVFHSRRGVHVIDVAGGGELQLTDGGTGSWSPDGSRIVFTNSDGIAVMDADGSNVAQLIRHDFRTDTYAPWDMGVANPAWSPDGAHIAFQHSGDGDTQPAQLFVMNADGSQVRRGTDPGNGYRYAESDPAWTPDGSSIVFWSYGTGISAVAANGGVPKSILMMFPAVAYGARPTQSPDGTIAFTARDRTSGRTDIWTVHETGEAAKLLIVNGYDAAFSPSGHKIAFTRH